MVCGVVSVYGTLTYRVIMTISQVKPGTVVETLHWGTPSGNVYRVAARAGWGEYVYAYRASRQGKTRIPAHVDCRVLDDFDGSF